MEYIRNLATNLHKGMRKKRLRGKGEIRKEGRKERKKERKKEK